MAKDSFYFSHDYNARNDDKILELRLHFGAEGYGIFWMLLETMAENDNGGVKASLMGGLSVGYGVAITTLKAIIQKCIEIELFYEENGIIFSKRLLTHKYIRKNLSDAGRAGAEKRWGSHSPPIADPMPKERKGKENKEKEILKKGRQTIKTEIKGLGNIEIFLLANCEQWQYNCLSDMITKSQSEFETMAMNKMELKTVINFQVLLQDFVNRIQEGGQYQDTAGLKRYFRNWVNDKNGTLDQYINQLKSKGSSKSANTFV